MRILVLSASLLLASALATGGQAQMMQRGNIGVQHPVFHNDGRFFHRNHHFFRDRDRFFFSFGFPFPPVAYAPYYYPPPYYCGPPYYPPCPYAAY
jgi:hypothetical protein